MQLKSDSPAEVLRIRRTVLGEALVASIADWEKYPSAGRADAESLAEFVRLELLIFVDYLAIFFEKGDASYRDLYIGEKLKQCYEPGNSAEAYLARKKQVTESDRAIFVRELQPHLTAEQMARLTATLDDIHRIVIDPGRKRAKVLFVGDCLHLDVVSFLAGPLLSHGITLEPTYATSKNPVELHRFLRDLDGRTFDIVFFSPFTYSFHIEYSELQLIRTAAASAARLRAIAEAAEQDALKTMRLLGDLFEAPILVHNSANIRRHNGTLKERAKNLGTLRPRSVARKLVNAWLPGQLEQLNSQSFRHFFLLNEAALLSSHSEEALGSLFYDSELQHPAEFGRVAAGIYLDAIVTQIQLSKKKVIVCDLDNTLWSGVIGEGAVTHYIDKQKTLKALRHKGVLLAIASKNNPANVKWTGAALNEDDFVSSQINWEPKVGNIRRIASELNLKLKDFLFIDDRADERAMVGEMLPEVETLDAESPDVWRRLALLADMLPEQDELDRTLAYKQREERQKFLEDPAAAAAEQLDMFRKLKLQVTIRSAGAKELKRVAELVNRTNQFNMCGSRTTLKEVTQWHESADHSVLVVEAGDKFGTMGVVSVAVTSRLPDRVEIPIFVLSCRVFGYGVEKALLNYVRRAAGHTNGGTGKPVVGLYQETAYNEPCRRAYPDNGFEWEEDRWVFRAGPEPEDPDWLTVHADALPALAR